MLAPTVGRTAAAFHASVAERKTARGCAIYRKVGSAFSGNVLASEDDKFPRDGIVLHLQARPGKPFDQGVDRHLAVDESREINRGLQCCNRGTRSPWDDLCTHDAQCARSRACSAVSEIMEKIADM